ncbi:MAG: response regulator [Hyphomicrobiaceae bacterium]|nr:response regulator [Hyphomicrobiaceae bacterium]
MTMLARSFWGHKRGLSVLIGIGLMLLIGVGAVFGTLVVHQREMRERVSEDVLWAAYQLDRETTKLSNALLTRAQDPTAMSTEQLAQRYDILYSRTDYITKGHFPGRFGGDRRVLELMHQIDAGVRALTPAFDEIAAGTEPDVATVLGLRARVMAIQGGTERFLGLTNSIHSDLETYSRQKTQTLYMALAAGVSLLTATMVAAITLLRSQLRTIGLAHARSERLSRDLERALVAAEDGARVKSAFLATMSHEIRTPMNGVIGMASLLSSTDLSHEQRRYVRTIEECSVALLALIDDVLDFTKLESGRLEVEATPAIVADLADGAADIVRDRIESKGLTLAVNLAYDLPDVVITDGARIRQVLLNLLGNAAKFTDTGTVTLNVFSRKGADEGIHVLRFEVVDTGIGISNEAQVRLFQEFSQVDASINRRYGGSGLGLAISRKIVHALDGRIGVDSTTGQGSRFWFEIPVEEINLAPMMVRGPVSRRIEATSETHAPTRERLNILVVEDNSVNKEVVRALLEKLGHTVDVASDGRESLEALGKARYDLVFMDMQMPVMDGLEATRRIREMPEPVASVRIVGLTANAFISDRNKCLEAGMDEFVTKPIDRAKLEAVLARKFERHSAILGDLAERPSGPAPVAAADDLDAATIVAEGREMREMLAGELGADRVDTLYQLFWSEADTMMAALPEMIARNDTITVDRLLHTIKGSAGNLGFATLARVAESLRDRPLPEGLSDIEAFLRPLTRAIERTRALTVAAPASAEAADTSPGSAFQMA